MKSSFKKAVLWAVTAAMVLGSVVSLSGAKAEAKASYKYTITVSGGNVLPDFSQKQTKAAGETVSLAGAIASAQSALPSDSKYYVKGVRLAGRDKTENLADPAFKVTEDQEYVIDYGVKGDLTHYQVWYLDPTANGLILQPDDGNGNKLPNPQTFTGNVGDEVVIAFQYVDGYQPCAYNVKLTLSANEAENVVYFYYVPVGQPIPTQIVTVTPNPDATPIVSSDSTDSDSSDSDSSDSDSSDSDSSDSDSSDSSDSSSSDVVSVVTVVPTETPGQDTTGPAVNPGGDGTSTEESSEPAVDEDGNVITNPNGTSNQELSDMGLGEALGRLFGVSDEQVPLANLVLDKQGNLNNLGIGVVAVGSCLAGAVIFLIVFLIVKRKKKMAED